MKFFNGVPALPGTFGFVMTDDHGKVVDMTANGLYGKIRFDELTFDEPGVYHYRIMEIIGIDPFVVYDATVYDVYVTVTPGEDGYDTTVTFKKNGLPYCGIPYFYNHTRTPAKVDIEAQKFLDGKFPPAGEFEFVLADGKGNIVDKVTNDKFGKISFKDQKFYAPGVYKYQIYEVIGTDEGIVYDDTQYDVTYTVVQNLPIIDGYKVKADITKDGEAYEGIELLPYLAGKINFVFDWLFGFQDPHLVAFPITALGAVGAALGLVPSFVAEGWADGNAIAVFTAIGMCWSGYLSTHTAMLDSLGYRELTSKAILAHTIGGLTAAFIAHWIFVLYSLI